MWFFMASGNFVLLEIDSTAKVIKEIFFSQINCQQKIARAVATTSTSTCEIDESEIN